MAKHIKISIDVFDELIEAIEKFYEHKNRLQYYNIFKLSELKKHLLKTKHEQEIENAVFGDQKVIDQKPIKMKF